VSTKRRTEITIETDRVFVVSRRRISVLTWCVACGERVTMITPDEAAITARVSSRAIYRCMEAERVHFTETADGLLLVCTNSLSSTDSMIESETDGCI
jgi:hypothetical protein